MKNKSANLQYINLLQLLLVFSIVLVSEVAFGQTVKIGDHIQIKNKHSSRYLEICGGADCSVAPNGNGVSTNEDRNSRGTKGGVWVIRSKNNRPAGSPLRIDDEIQLINQHSGHLLEICGNSSCSATVRGNGVNTNASDRGNASIWIVESATGRRSGTIELNEQIYFKNKHSSHYLEICGASTCGATERSGEGVVTNANKNSRAGAESIWVIESALIKNGDVLNLRNGHSFKFLEVCGDANCGAAQSGNGVFTNAQLNERAGFEANWKIELTQGLVDRPIRIGDEVFLKNMHRGHYLEICGASTCNAVSNGNGVVTNANKNSRSGTETIWIVESATGRRSGTVGIGERIYFRNKFSSHYLEICGASTCGATERSGEGVVTNANKNSRAGAESIWIVESAAGRKTRSFKFAATADTQYDNRAEDQSCAGSDLCDNNDVTGDGGNECNVIRRACTSNEVLRRIKGGLDNGTYKGLIIAGDLTQNARRDEIQMFYNNFTERNLALNTLKKRTSDLAKIFEGAGNHDRDDEAECCNGASSGDFCNCPGDIREIIGRDRSSSTDTYKSFGNEVDDDDDDGDAPTKAGHYMWTWGGATGKVHFLQLNVMPSDEESSSNQNISPFMGLSTLRDMLKSIHRDEPVIIIHHYGFDDFSKEDRWWTRQMRRDYLKAIKDHNIIGIISGHLHNNSTRNDWWRNAVQMPSGSRNRTVQNFVAGGAWFGYWLDCTIRIDDGIRGWDQLVVRRMNHHRVIASFTVNIN